MRVLLTTLNAKYIHSNLALKYVYCLLTEANLDVDVHIEEFTINNEQALIYNKILREGYDLVCFSCYIWNIESIRTLSRNLKKARPDMKILMAGPEVSYDSLEFMYQNPWIDYIISGEGEKDLVDFVRAFAEGRKDLRQVHSLWYWDGKYVENTQEGPPVSLDDLPFPYTYMELEDNKIIYYEASRGCPFHCSYCLSAVSDGVRPVSMEKLRRDIGYFLYKAVPQVKFLDRTFNYDGARAREIWRFLMDRDNGVTNFHFEICADLLGEEDFRLLREARKGLFQFEVGVQSTDEAALGFVRRKNVTEKTLANIRSLAALGNAHVHADLIAGLPGEDYHTFGKSFDQLYACRADHLQLGFLKLLKGTPLRESAFEHDYVYMEEAPYEVIASRYMRSIDLAKLKMVAKVLDLFHNRGGFQRTLAGFCEEMSLTPFHMYEMLADHYFGKGYDMAAHKKEDLYRIVHQVAERYEDRYPGLLAKIERYLSLDMIDTLKPEVVDRFMRKGWTIR